MDHTVLDLARLTPEAVPALIAGWHREHAVGDEFVVRGQWRGPVPFATVALGAGTTVIGATEGLGQAQWTLRRERTLADLIGPRLRVLVVGLNPSLVAADAGVGFAGATNRFWPAAVAAGLVPIDRDPWAAFTSARVGFTDLVKRASPRADGLTTAEFADGAARLRALVDWFGPAVVCFAGVTGYRKAIDRHAALGAQPSTFAGAAAYVMPNPSGVNTHASLAELTTHFTAVRALAHD